MRIETVVETAAPSWRHAEAVVRQGGQLCLAACHDPVFCAACHVKGLSDAPSS